MRALSGVRRACRRRVDLRLFGDGRVWFVSALVATVLVSMLTPLPHPGRASAAECPPGYVLEGGGLLAHCVPMIDPGNVDLGVGDGQVLDDGDPIQGNDSPPQLTPVVIDIDPEENPTIDPPVVIDVEPQDQDNPTIDLNGLPVLLPTDDEFAVIEISKQECPEDYDAYNADIYDLALNCNTPMAQVKFLVSDGAGFVVQGTTDANGSLGLGLEQGGPLSVVEQVPDGYGEPVVFCTSYQIVNNQPVEEGPTKMTIDDGNQFFYIFEAGETLNCNWFNVPGSYELTPIAVHERTPVVAPQLTPIVFEPTASPEN